MRSRSYQFLLIVLALTIASGFLFYFGKFRLGLDIQGGIRIRYSLNMAELEKSGSKLSKAQARTRVIRVIETRVTGLGATEATVQEKGTSDVVVEIPGVVDKDKARKLLGTTASLEWYHAKNVQTALISDRPYSYDKDDKADLVVRFIDRRGNKIEPGTEAYQKVIDGWEPILKGDDLAEAQVQPDAGGSIPALLFSKAGADKMETWTRRYKDREENLAAVLDGKVISIAPLHKGAIIKERGVIQGTFPDGYVRQLVDLLNSGALPVSLKEESVQTVAPTIGEKALNQILLAGAIAFGIIVVFMLGYYMFPGIVAVIALILYTLFTLSVLKWFTVFSLAGIAAFILSVGMAVDANILVFERVKEELRLGKDLKAAIDIGFKRALTAIVDSNMCTILTSLVLMWYGTGLVKGFASVLIVSVLISLFTAVTVTRSLLVFLMGMGLGNHPNWFGLKRQWFGRLETSAHQEPLNIVNKCGRYFLISLITIVPGIYFASVGGIKKNVEFQGGYEIDINTKGKSISTNEIIANLDKEGMKGSNVKLLDSGRVVSITVPPVEKYKDKDDEAKDAIARVAGFTKDDVESYTVVGPTVQGETVKNAVMGVIISSILIVIYLGLRFGVAVGGFVMGLRFSLSAIGALLHDILVVLGLAAVAGYFMGWEISSLFITAVLTMIGFSTHDTIVIFDRIRENLRRPHQGETFDHLVNRSITQSFARSINTSGTVIITLVVLIAVGSATTDLRFFNLAMLIGIISGTYSSIYNAAPLLYLWDRAIWKNAPEKALMEISSKEMLHVRPISTTVSTDDSSSKKKAADDKSAAYGTVKRRRASAVQKSHQNIDEDL